MGRIREQEKIRELVSAYLDGELPPDDAQFVGKRIQEDPAYAQVYAAYRGIRMDLRALVRPEVPASVSKTIRARAAVMQPGRAGLNIRQRIARFTAAAATLAATFAALLTGGFGLQHHFTHAVPGTGQPNPVVIVANNPQTTATILNPNIRFDEPAQIHFTRLMNEQTVLNSVIFSPTVAISNLQYDKSSFILSTKPKTLIPRTQYTVHIPAGLKDAEGNEVAPDAFVFSVGDVTPGITGQPTTSPATAAASPTPFTIAAATTATAAPQTDATTVPPVTSNAPAATEPPPVAPTATRPAVAPPKPSNTPVPPAKPAGTVIAVSEPTTVPTVAPTVAPTATPAPTVVPTPTTPAIAVADKFKGAYAATANRLGSPISGASSVGTSQLFFQNGFMLYVAGQPIYVFYTGDRSFAAYPNPGNSGAGSEGGAGPSAGLYKPINAFGIVWTSKGLQSKLGYATSPSESGGSGTIQAFENGSILSIGSDVYVLLKNGTWQPFSG